MVFEWRLFSLYFKGYPFFFEGLCPCVLCVRVCVYVKVTDRFPPLCPFHAKTNPFPNVCVCEQASKQAEGKAFFYLPLIPTTILLPLNPACGDKLLYPPSLLIPSLIHPPPPLPPPPPPPFFFSPSKTSPTSILNNFKNLKHFIY